MKRGMTGLAVLLLLLVAVSSVNAWTCSSNCSCGIGPGYVYANCPSPRYTVSVFNYIGSILKITCYETTTDLKLLEGFEMGIVPRVVFKNCQMPQKNYSVLLESMKAEYTTGLDICDSTLSPTDLRDRLFGLDGITSLSLNNLGLVNVPENFLQNVPHLTSLDLRYNNIQLPLGLFDYVPSLKTLEISGNGLRYLEPNIFRNLKQLHRLSAWSNRLQNLTRETFAGLNQLVGLDLANNGIEKFEDDVFAELHNLKELALAANNFTELPSNLFRNTSMLEMVRMNDNRRELTSLPSGFLANLTNLQKIYLHSMYLSDLPEDLFHGSVNLINVTLYGNNLRTLPELIFKDTIHLKTLDLSRNKLEQLPDNVFSRLSELQLLDLSNNRLTHINQNLFTNLNNIVTLSLRQNAITNIQTGAFFNLQKLWKIDISSNMLDFSEDTRSFGYNSPFTNCKNIEYLHLSNNSISTIFDDWRFVMLRLKLLDLSYNQLTSIKVRDLMFLARSVRLDLTYNKITTIDLQWAESIARNSIGSDGGAVRNTTVYLDGNPLHCDCEVYDFLRYLELKIAPEVHSMFELIPGNLQCTAPPMYNGTQVSLLRAQHFVCDYKDEKSQEDMECPRQCICFAKPFTKALIVNCSNAGLSRAPDEVPLVTNRMTSQTQLFLQNNNITSLPNATQPGYANVTLIDVSYNRLNSVNVAQLPQKLLTLHLDHNHLTQLDNKVLQFLTNRTTVTLQGNPWTCTCNNREFLTFLQSQFKQVRDRYNITCRAENGSSLHLSHMTIEDICPTDTMLIVILGITIGIVGLVLGAIATLYYRYQQELKIWLYAHNMLLWWVTEDELDKDKLFDAFVSFSHKDEDFVVNDLVPGLEKGPKPFKLCLHFRDWIAGEFIPLQIARSVSESRRTLVVLSPNFLESVWGRMEFRAAHQQALSEGRARVILLLYGDIGPVESLDPELKTYLSMNTYVKWGDPWFWDKLRYALPHRSPVKEKHYHLNTAAVSDKMDLMFPAMSVPAATTPPADAINPVFIMEDKAAAQKEAKLNGQLVFTDPQSGYLKCV